MPKTLEAPQRTYCRVISHKGVEDLTREQYDGLLFSQKKYDMFIDGFTRSSTCPCKGKAGATTLTAGEYAIIREYMESPRSMCPNKTETGKNRSYHTASKLFERARAKVDLKVGRYMYRAFRMNKFMDSSQKSFEFIPTPSLKYCLIIPQAA